MHGMIHSANVDELAA